MKHTPGPWFIQWFYNDDGSKSGDVYLCDEGGSLLEGSLTSESDEENDANAALIAAAPGLLAENTRLRARVRSLEAERDRARQALREEIEAEDEAHDEWRESFDTMEASRNRWKARCETLESALREVESRCQLPSMDGVITACAACGARGIPEQKVKPTHTPDCPFAALTGAEEEKE